MNDPRIIGKIQDRLYESPIKEDLGDHLEECTFNETAECNCKDISEAERENFLEDQAMENYFRDKYGD